MTPALRAALLSSVMTLALAAPAWAGARRVYAATQGEAHDAVISFFNDWNTRMPKVAIGSNQFPVNDHGSTIDNFHSGLFALKDGCSIALSPVAMRQTQLEVNCKDYHGVYGQDPAFEKTVVDAIERFVPKQPPPAAEQEAAPPVQSAPQAEEPPATAKPPKQQKPAAKESDVDRLGAAKPERPDDFALVVGIEKYQSVPFSADYGERDAESAKKYFRWLGVPEENIVSLTGSNATRTGIDKYLEEWLPRNVTPRSRVYFYFSGHGGPEPVSGTAYLLPWDGDPSFLKSTGYPVSRLYQTLQSLKAKEVLVFLDSCFSGAGGRSVLAKGARPLVNVVAAAPTGPKLTVLTAAAGEEITGSLEEQGHGLFTYHMLKGLTGEADLDHDGHVSVSELHAYVQQKVQRAARRQNREQTPQLFSAKKELRIY